MYILELMQKKGQEAPPKKYVSYFYLLPYSQVAGVDVARAAFVHVEALNLALEGDVARALKFGIDGAATTEKLDVDVARATELQLGAEGVHLADVKIARADEGGCGLAGVKMLDIQVARAYELGIAAVANHIGELHIARALEAEFKIVGINTALTDEIA